MKETRDGLNFGEMHVPRLFRKLFIPTLLGLLAGVLLTLADGIAVGRGVGSDALAAVNVAAPVYMITTGLALMFGSGVSIVASTHLAKGNRKVANINVTQAFLVPTLIMLAVVIILNLFPSIFCILLGGSEKLFPYVKEYWQYVSPALVMLVILTTGLFVARIDGAPNFGMMVNVIVAIINIILDYLLVFPLDMGIKGAALATSAATTTGAVAMLWYFTRHSRILRLYRIKLSQTSLRLTRRNCNYMVKLGMPTFVAETAMTCIFHVYEPTSGRWCGSLQCCLLSIPTRLHVRQCHCSICPTHCKLQPRIGQSCTCETSIPHLNDSCHDIRFSSDTAGLCSGTFHRKRLYRFRNASSQHRGSRSTIICSYLSILYTQYRVNRILPEYGVLSSFHYIHGASRICLDNTFLPFPTVNTQ